MIRNTKKLQITPGIRNCAVVLLLATTLNAQDLSARLAQPATYQPQATATLDRLIEVAQHYRIPMGIEWIQETKAETEPLAEPVKQRTVNDLIIAILQQSPGYLAQQRDGVLQIVPTDFLDKDENFLNLRFSEFKLQDASVFDAEASLRMYILLKLHPGRGFGGGYGTPDENGFDKPTITFAGNDLSVREILNKIVTGNGNALWVVQFSSAQKMPGRSFRAQVSLNDGQAMPNFHWRVLPLAKH